MSRHQAERAAQKASRGGRAWVVFDGGSYDFTADEVELDSFFSGCQVISFFENGEVSA